MMKIHIPILCLALMTTGCQTKTITPQDMLKIRSKSVESGLSLHANPWTYVGSEDGYDYLLYSGVVLEQRMYRVLAGQLHIAVPFKRTVDRSAWVRYNF